MWLIKACACAEALVDSWSHAQNNLQAGGSTTHQSLAAHAKHPASRCAHRASGRACRPVLPRCMLNKQQHCFTMALMPVYWGSAGNMAWCTDLHSHGGPLLHLPASAAAHGAAPCPPQWDASKRRTAQITKRSRNRFIHASTPVCSSALSVA
jgi:hypothetical protein